MTRTCDAIVVGAGIVGAACAAALSREGLRVTVVDSGPIGGGATAAGMGHIVVIDEPPAEFALTHLSRRLWNDLAPQLPASAERSVTGTLWIAEDDEELAAAEAKLARLLAAGVHAELLDSAALANAEPRLRSGLRGGLRVPDDHIVYPPTVARWLLDQACRNGIIGQRVVGIEPGVVILDDGESLTAKFIINAAGIHAAALTPGLPIRPRKGHLLISDRYPAVCQHQIVELGYIKNAHGTARETVAFNIQPRPTGQILIGSTRQFDTLDPAIEPRIIARLVDRAIGFMPCLANVRILRAWTGFRAATPDGLPIIGEHPNQPGVFLAVGHEGLGATTSLGTADLLADEIMKRQPAIPAAPYSPARFFGSTTRVS